MKTKEELNALKNEVEALNAKLAELNEDEMKEVTGGDENEWIDGYWQKIKDYFQKRKPAIH